MLRIRRHRQRRIKPVHLVELIRPRHFVARHVQPPAPHVGDPLRLVQVFLAAPQRRFRPPPLLNLLHQRCIRRRQFPRALFDLLFQLRVRRRQRRPRPIPLHPVGQHLADQDRRQRIRRHHRNRNPLGHLQPHVSRQRQHQQHHRPMNQQAHRQQIPNANAAPPPHVHKMENGPQQHRRPDHVGPRMRTNSPLPQPANHRHPAGQHPRQRPEKQRAQTQHHRPPVENQPRPHSQRIQHPDDRDAPEQQPLQHRPRPMLVPARPNESG